MSPERSRVLRNIHIVLFREHGWERSVEALEQDREHATTILIELLNTQPPTQKYLPLLEVLSRSEQPHCLNTLLRYAVVLDEAVSPLRWFLAGMGQRATPPDLYALLELLARARNPLRQQTPIPNWVAHQAAEVVVELAERSTLPDLRAALPLLAPHPRLPLSYVLLRRRLRLALSRETLPIPAQPMVDETNLPLPHSPETQDPA